MTERTTVKMWTNDWGGVLGAAAERGLRNTPEAFAVMAWKDDHGRLELAQFDTHAALEARLLLDLPWAYAVVKRVRTPAG